MISYIYTCTHMYMCTHIHDALHLHMYTCTHMYMCAHIHDALRTFTRVHTCTHMHTHVYYHALSCLGKNVKMARPGSYGDSDGSDEFQESFQDFPPSPNPPPSSSSSYTTAVQLGSQPHQTHQVHFNITGSTNPDPAASTESHEIVRGRDMAGGREQRVGKG